MKIECTIADIDSQLSNTGQFSILEWLLAHNHLPYASYEAWRHGELNSLETALACNQDELAALLESANHACRLLKLQAESAAYYAWNAEQKPLQLSLSTPLHQALAKIWRRPEDMPQLDLFMDNAAVISENTLLQDLAARLFSKAQLSLKKLTNLNPRNPKLGAYQDLINYGQHMETQQRIAAEDYDAELEGLLREVVPLAKETLKAFSRDYLAQGWRRLADNATDPNPDATATSASPWRHSAAFALSQIPDWQGVRSCLQENPVTYQHPELMCLLANAYFYSNEPQLSYCVWGQIAERFPQFAESAFAKHELTTGHPFPIQIWDAFLDYDSHWPSQWFLGFLLMTRPGLAHVFDAVPAVGGAAIVNPVNQVARELVQAKVFGKDQTPLRAQLKSIAPSLLGYFLNS